MKLFILLALSLNTLSATPVGYTYTFSDRYAGASATGRGSDDDVIGQLQLFDLDRVVVSGTGGSVRIDVYMNYNNGDTNLSGMLVGALPMLNPGDVMISDGNRRWAASLVTHNNLGLSSAGLTAGNLYNVAGFLTAATVLNNSDGGNYRKTSNVWGDANGATQAGAGSFSATATGGAQIKASIEFVTNDAAFIHALETGGFSLEYASATCGNDVLDSSSPVPEPLTSVLIGSGLIGIGLIRRRRN